MKIEVKNPETVVKRAFWLAYQACGGASGMGALKARNGATEDDVWQNVQQAGDYPMKIGGHIPGEASGDYVFGRMMKLYIKWNGTSVEVQDSTPRGDYQSWCRQYPTYDSLIEAAVKSLE